MKAVLKIITAIISPIIATILSLVTKNFLLNLFEVELDAADRLGNLLELSFLPVFYIVFLVLLFYLLDGKKSFLFTIIISQISFLAITTIYHLYEYRNSFYSIGTAT
jgi:tellurite resistance protein TehA-like permease